MYVKTWYFPVTYASIEERAEEALEFCKEEGLDTTRCIFVDFSIQSNTPRFFIYDLQRKKIVKRGLCAHGKGAPSTPERPAFSNRLGSNCSSVGKFRVGGFNRGKRVGRSYVLDGYDRFLNSNARTRGILIHTSGTINRHEWNPLCEAIPLGRVSEGCFTVSTSTFNKLHNIKQKSKKPMLLWAYDGEKY